jgi:hypothetical protein
MYTNYVHTAESEGKACTGAYLQPGLNMKFEIYSKRSLNPSNSWNNFSTPSIPMGRKPMNLPF